MSNTKEVYLTEEGYDKIKKELEYLKMEKRPEVINALKEARALGDLSENAEYDAARTEQAEVENRIIEHAEIIDNKKKNEVSLGSTVTISYDDGEEEEYKIVGSMEADPFENKISNESPLGIALLKHKIGDSVEVASPNGGYIIKIKKIA